MKLTLVDLFISGDAAFQVDLTLKQVAVAENECDMHYIKVGALSSSLGVSS